MTIELLQDLHGFPTFAVHFKGTRYNFCHLVDVFALQQKVFNVDNDKLLIHQRKPRHYAKHIVAKADRTLHRLLRDFILSLVETHTTITSKEAYQYVNVEFDNQFTYKQFANTVMYLMESNQIASAGRGRYKKVLSDGLSRELPRDHEAAS